MKTGMICFLLAIAGTAQAQNRTDADHVTIITAEQVQAVLKSSNSTDKSLRVLDMGDYQLSVGIVHRGATPAGAASPGTATAAQAARPAGPTCGLAAAPAGAAPGQRGMISHSDTTETYIITAGGGTLVTGGQIVAGTPSAADSEVTKILNGPSCSGTVYGPTVSRDMKVGDIAVIPAGVPHGWTNIRDEVNYLSVRPDPKKVLQHGYVNPALK